MVKKKQRISKKILVSPFKDYWNKANYIFFATGIIVLLVGFILMGQAPWDNPVSLSISPVVLLLAYIIIFPLAIFYKKRDNKEETQ